MQTKMNFYTRWLAGAGLALTVVATPAWAFSPGSTECVAPAGAGGGWDMMCRFMGKTLQDLKLVPGTMQVTNKPGGGGGAAYAEVVAKRSAENNLIVAASSNTAVRLAQGAYPGNTEDQVRWLGAVGVDYGAVAVAADSPFNTLPELMAKVKENPSQFSFAGGSAVGGGDHLKALTVARKTGVNNLRSIKYVAFDGGGEAVTQLLGGKVQAFTGDISEVKGFVDAGKLKVLAILAPQRLDGEYSKFPTAREQGIDVVSANWRGFFAPGKASDEAYNFWVKSLATAYASKEWREIMAKQGWSSLDVRGPDFQKYVKDSIQEYQVLSREIGLIK